MISYNCKFCERSMRLNQNRACLQSGMSDFGECIPTEAPPPPSQGIDMKPLKCPSPLACSAEGCHGKCPGSTSRAYALEKLKAELRDDPVVEAVRADLLARSRTGQAKYGTTLARKDLGLRDWLQHALEEAEDMALYLKRAIMELDQ